MGLEEKAELNLLESGWLYLGVGAATLGLLVYGTVKFAEKSCEYFSPYLDLGNYISIN